MLVLYIWSRTRASTARWSWRSLSRSTYQSLGFDRQNEEYVDMFKAGIIDPTKVARTALQDAASVRGPG